MFGCKSAELKFIGVVGRNPGRDLTTDIIVINSLGQSVPCVSASRLVY